ncbi:extradiol ring-cleavage dioxygenase [Pseudomonas alcaligenes]|uniref:Extradiol ring-cleavage dioxygenase n=1 Tax=Aquipseudomonas alcaligenes TaxID=43263 RepID=A0ABR7RY44_AQUAC|nr:VOC family protein [Pseudomonas alcaligenes]MBC9249392.1 extradiol ring-cleavage dioxygenase [Pseudomonas alcaligenes]
MNQDIFGASSMGYAVIESNRLERWQALLQDGIGLHLQHADSSTLAFRMDHHQRRLIIQRGPAEDFAAIGWQLRDQATLDIVLLRLQARGIAVQVSSAVEAAERGVQRFWRVQGPKRLAIELFVDAVTTSEPLDMLSQGFITGAAGMGHLAITSRRGQDMRRFWEEIFDARQSDTIVEQLGGVTLDIEFFRVNPRHHSIAIAQVRGMPIDPIRTQVQHMNLLTTSVSELTDAFLRCRQLGFEMAHEIGEHPNDREQSFYVLSPSGFEIELGWNALEVDEASWQTTTYQGISLWGHKPPKRSAWHKLKTNLGNLGQGLRSLRAAEYSPL